MSMIRKIGLMHKLYGIGDGICGTCSHFVEGRYHTKILRKCEIYGLTHSEASDWARRWKACGLKNKETGHENVIRLVRRENLAQSLPEELDGQVEMERQNEW